MKKFLIITTLMLMILVSCFSTTVSAADTKPNGTAYQLEIKNIKEETLNNGTKIDKMTVNNFKLTISGKLKEQGYRTELSKNNTVLNIISNDNLYRCKIAMFSDVTPYILTDDQKTELNNLYEELAKEACDKKGISKSDDNYYEVYYDEYYKLDVTNKKIAAFYSKYNLNRYTSFESFTNEEYKKAWELVGVNEVFLSNPSDFIKEYYGGGVTKTTIPTDSGICYQYEFDKNITLNGLFLMNTTGEDSNTDGYDVEFSWLSKTITNSDSSNSNTQPAKPIKEVLIIPPSQTKYDVGEKLNTEGIKITVIYEDGSIEEVSKGYTIKGYNKNKAGKQTLTINYKGHTTTYDVKVGNVSSIDVNETGKLPQTGDFLDFKDILYICCAVLSIVLIFIVFKSVKYNNIKK